MKKNQTSKYLILLALLIVLMMNFVDAEVLPFTTRLKIEINNDTINLQTESGQYAYVCSGSYTNNIDVSFFRNATCITDTILQQDQQIIQTLSASVNDSTKYYDKYLECYGNLKLLQSSTNNTDYFAKYTQCFEEWNICKSDKGALTTARQASDSALSTCQTEKKSSDDAKTLFGVGGIVIGLGIYYLFIDKGRRKPAVSVAEQQLPKSR